uniref:Related to CNS1-cyclophilin seven suppressor n=1 Tax=Melanopsichium pennsylvanicum 4 TaxID=1398559 RepID=A0A077R4Y7_9BASI|nr:related to CNS1-cyclophilin seven suppressor [Melanopsichium pennsylvanicum 4]
MSVIEAVQNNGTTTSSKPSLARPPPRSVDFTYAQPTDKPRNLDDTLKSWDSVPLFMKQLPTESSRTDDESTQVALDALESLTFDGTSDEVALNFKSQANEYFKSKRYREALGFYSQAIQAQPVDKSLLETLYANRAACNLELQNYGATLRDTGKVIAMNPNNEKAYYRATKALIALDRFNDAQECQAEEVWVQKFKATREKQLKK